MSLLQDPLKSLNQINWYLTNQSLESFPGAFLLAAGNLSRQVLEQILFILAFYGKMPTSSYMKTNRQLKTAGVVLKALRQIDPISGDSYIEQARKQSPRISKFARHQRSFDKWRDEFNEPSHFRNPAAKRRTREDSIRSFSQRMHKVFDPLDSYLITAAVNELLSKGKVQAFIDNDKQSTPGVKVDLIVDVKDIALENGNLTLTPPKMPLRIVPDTEDVPLRVSKSVILVQHSVGMKFQGRFITRTGNPVDLSTASGMLESFTESPTDSKRLIKHLKTLGFVINQDTT